MSFLGGREAFKIRFILLCFSVFIRWAVCACTDVLFCTALAMFSCSAQVCRIVSALCMVRRRCRRARRYILWTFGVEVVSRFLFSLSAISLWWTCKCLIFIRFPWDFRRAIVQNDTVAATCWNSGTSRWYLWKTCGSVVQQFPWTRWFLKRWVEEVVVRSVGRVCFGFFVKFPDDVV